MNFYKDHVTSLYVLLSKKYMQVVYLNCEKDLIEEVNGCDIWPE